MAIRVRMIVFSGLRNPEWELTPGQAAELRARIAGLPSMPDAPTPRTGLGYHGFQLDLGTPTAALPQHLSVFEGVVVAAREATGPALRDDGRALEAWLLETAPPALSAEAVRAASASLGAG